MGVYDGMEPELIEEMCAHAKLDCQKSYIFKESGSNESNISSLKMPLESVI